jgi:hypothetical protein
MSLSRYIIYGMFFTAVQVVLAPLCGQVNMLYFGQEGSHYPGLETTNPLSQAGMHAVKDSALMTSPLFSPLEEKPRSWTLGTDLVSSYVWRGTRQGRGPHLQPYAEYTAGLVTGGVWGTFDFHGYREIDLYLTLDMPGGFNISLQDYWMADQPWNDFSAISGSHALEAGIGYESDNVSLTAFYIINEAGGAGSYGGDLYFESRFSFDYFTIIMGAGNGWHTEEGRFAVCCVGMETGLEIPVTASFTIPISAQLVYNPDSRLIFIGAVVSFSVPLGD